MDESILGQAVSEADLTAGEAENTQVEQVEAPVEPVVEATKEPEKLVPLAALHEARAQLKELKERERLHADRLAKIEEAYKKAQEEEAKASIPDFNEDPANHLKAETEYTKKQLQQINEQLQKTQQSQEEFARQQQVQSQVVAAEQEFIKANPDYHDAIKHLYGVIDKNFELMGLDPAQRQEALRQQAEGLAMSALRAGRNPAEVAYGIAKNWGYQTKAPVTKIETIQKGQEAAKTLGSQGKVETPLTLSTLEKMDEDEFNALIADEKRWKKLVASL